MSGIQSLPKDLILVAVWLPGQALWSRPYVQLQLLRGAMTFFFVVLLYLGKI